MKDFDSLVGIWKEQKTAPVIDYKEVIGNYKTKREKLSLKFIKEILWMIPAVAAIVYLSFAIDFNFWTSYLGLSIFAVCCFYFIIIQIINIKNILNSNTLFDKPQDHIQFIQRFRKARYQQHTRNYKVYMIALSVGICLYAIEFFYNMDAKWMIFGIVAAIIWFTLSFMYLRNLMKIYINKEETKLNEMIADLERLNEQFKDVE